MPGTKGGKGHPGGMNSQPLPPGKLNPDGQQRPRLRHKRAKREERKKHLPRIEKAAGPPGNVAFPDFEGETTIKKGQGGHPLGSSAKRNLSPN